MAVSFVSVDEVRKFLQKPDGDEQQDQIIGRLIECASKAMMSCAEREFVTAPAAATARQFYYPGNGLLSLTPYDVQTVTEVRIDSVDGVGGTVLAATDYRLMPKPAKDGVYNWLKLSPFVAGTPNTNFADREVTITGAWGFPAVPDDVKHWATVTVQEWLRKDVQGFSTVFNIDEGRLERPEALPSAVRAGLRKYWMPVA